MSSYLTKYYLNIILLLPNSARREFYANKFRHKNATFDHPRDRWHFLNFQYYSKWSTDTIVIITTLSKCIFDTCTWLHFPRKNVGHPTITLFHSTLEWKDICQLKSANCLLSRERKGEMKSLSHMITNIPSFTIFYSPRLIFNLTMLKRNRKLPSKLHLLQSYSPILNNGVFIKPRENATSCCNH